MSSILYGFIAAVTVVLYQTVFQPAFLAPLAAIPPAHWSARFSGLWILWARYRRKENRTIHAAHQRLGPIVRLGPAEVSVNDLHGLKTVYAGGWEKPAWYTLFRNYEGSPNMFTMLDSHSHSQRKRQLSNIYAKSYLQRSPELQAITQEVLKGRFLGLIDRAAKTGEGIEVSDILYRLGMDSISCYMFGIESGTNMLKHAAIFHRFRESYETRGTYAFIAQEIPWLWALLHGIRLPPYDNRVDRARKNVDQLCEDMCNAIIERIENNQDSNEEAIVFKQLRKAEQRKKSESPSNPEHDIEIDPSIASELLDHLLAGFETTAIGLTFALHHLSARRDIQERLRRELRSLKTPFFKSSKVPIPPVAEVDRLPLLNAVLMETLRLNPPIPGPEPRISPAGALLNGNAELFPRPETWDPDRWIEGDRIPEMTKWFWAFSSGGRMCIGSNFAIIESKMALAAIYTNYETHIEDHGRCEQQDAYTAGPTDEVWLSFERAKG